MGWYGQEPRTVPAILRALNEAAGENPRLRALVDYPKRCDNWRKKLEAACLSVKRCEAAGAHHYAVETLGYIEWLIRRRPMKGRTDDIFGN